MQTEQVLSYLRRQKGSVIRVYIKYGYAVLCKGTDEVSRLQSKVWKEVGLSVSYVRDEGDIKVYA